MCSLCSVAFLIQEKFNFFPTNSKEFPEISIFFQTFPSFSEISGKKIEIF